MSGFVCGTGCEPWAPALELPRCGEECSRGCCVSTGGIGSHGDGLHVCPTAGNCPWSMPPLASPTQGYAVALKGEPHIRNTSKVRGSCCLILWVRGPLTVSKQPCDMRGHRTARSIVGWWEDLRIEVRQTQRPFQTGKGPNSFL